MQTVGAILLGFNVAIPIILNAQGFFPEWPYQYHLGIGFLVFVGFVTWIIFDKQNQINKLTSGDNLEIRVLPIGDRYKSQSPHYYLIPGRSITAIFGLQIINHSEDRKAHIEKAYLILRKKQFPLRRKILFSHSLEQMGSQIHEKIGEIEVGPQSKTPVYPISMHKAIPIIKKFPRKSKLVLVLELIGANRKIERDIEIFTHESKKIPDAPNSQ
ncbi:MAG: hypothetical protein JW845_06815 [Dehalococcoidales bacterium]|nr:hypothetical protein [Dehalococcoidales bacterium]